MRHRQHLSIGHVVGLIGCILLTPITVQSNCLAPSAWFPHSQTPEPNNHAQFQSNCDFHQWSWQTFLWLTQKTKPNNRPRFESMIRPAALFSNNPGNSPPPLSQIKADRGLALTPRTKKHDTPASLHEVNQAGSRGLLIDQNGRSVYYSKYVNKRFYKFVRKKGYYKPQRFYQAPKNENFPVGTIELKASWKVIEDGERHDNLYTRKAKIKRLANRNGHVVITNKTEEVTVGLVGLHVVGVVKNHPEFIWATFEHVDNAPDLPANLKPLTEHLNKVVSQRDWTFYQAGTTVKNSNANNASLVSLEDPQAQTLSPITQVFRQFPHGGGSSQNVQNIKSLNQSVHEQLGNNSIWRHYELVGAIWFNPNKGTLIPNSTLQDRITGSTELSNSTIETFTQGAKFQNNCFWCHNTKMKYPPASNSGVKPLPGKNLNLSHLLVNNYFRSAQRQRMEQRNTHNDKED